MNCTPHRFCGTASSLGWGEEKQYIDYDLSIFVFSVVLWIFSAILVFVLLVPIIEVSMVDSRVE